MWKQLTCAFLFPENQSLLYQLTDYMASLPKPAQNLSTFLQVSIKQSVGLVDSEQQTDGRAMSACFQ